MDLRSNNSELDKNKPLYFIYPIPKHIKTYFIPLIRPLGLLSLMSLTPNSYNKKLVIDKKKQQRISNAKGIFISVSTPQRDVALELCQRYIKRGINVYLGGPHVTLNPNDLVDYCTSIFIGNIESIWTDFLRDLDKGTQKKVYHGKSMKTIPRIEETNYKKWIYNTIETTRGCNFNCDFCCNPALNKRIIHKKTEDVVYEIKNYKGLFKKHLFFIDDNIIANPEYAKSLFHSIKPLNLRWYAQACTDISDNTKLLDLAYESGCRVLELGLEDLKKGYGKSKRKNEAYNNIRKISNKGIVTIGSFIIKPETTITDIKEIYKFGRKSRLDLLVINYLVPFPGTNLFEKVKPKIVENDLSCYDGNSQIIMSDHINQSFRGEVRSMNKEFYSLNKIIRYALNSRHNKRYTLLYIALCYALRNKL